MTELDVKSSADDVVLDDLRKEVREMVVTGDLETLTMRMVMRRLKERFPGVDWDGRKAWVVEEVDRAISAIEAGGGGDEGGERDGEGDEGEGNEGEGENEDEDDEEDAEEETASGRRRKSSGGQRKRKTKTTGLGRKRLTAFNKPVIVREPLAAFVGANVLPRTDVSRKIIEYVKSNNLQDPNDGRCIICDEQLRSIFKVEKFTFFSLNKLLVSMVEKAGDCADEDLRRKAHEMEEAMKLEFEAVEEDEKPKKRKRRQSDEDGQPRRGGLNQPMVPSEALASICGPDPLSRPQVVKKIWTYIREKGLQDPNDGRRILCDVALKTIFDDNEAVSAFGMNKFLGKHLTRCDEE